MNKKLTTLFPSTCTLFLIAIFQFWIISPTVSADEIIKCRSRTGRTIYSDVPCETQGASSLGMVNASPNGVGVLKPTPVDTRLSAGSAVTKAPESPARAVSKTPHKDPEERRRRERELGLMLNSMVSTYEQKEAARNELSNIASLGVCILSDEQLKRRDGAYAALGSLVEARRPPAFTVLRQILASCERG